MIAWDEVADAEGTGIVHIAPGCGKEDFDLGKMEGLPHRMPIDESGVYFDGFGFLTGRKAADVADDVIDDLQRQGRPVLQAERYSHRYPHCWRCGTDCCSGWWTSGTST